jgi:hypothetical protein
MGLTNTANGLDAASDMLYLHKMALNAKFKEDETMKYEFKVVTRLRTIMQTIFHLLMYIYSTFASKAALTSVAEAWEEVI